MAVLIVLCDEAESIKQSRIGINAPYGPDECGVGTAGAVAA